MSEVTPVSQPETTTESTDSASQLSSSPSSAVSSRLSALAGLAAAVTSLVISLKSASYVYQLALKGVLPAEWAVVAFIAIAAPTSAVGSGLVNRLKSAGTALLKGKDS